MGWLDYLKQKELEARSLITEEITMEKYQMLRRKLKFNLCCIAVIRTPIEVPGRISVKNHVQTQIRLHTVFRLLE